MSERLKAMLVRHEGLRLFPYLDSVGKLTIGVGHNLSDNGVTKDECNTMLNRDLEVAYRGLVSIIPDIIIWNEARQDALIDMMFNLGATRFAGFKKMIKALNDKDWNMAAKEMRDSKWAKQVGSRAEELARMVETGEYVN